MVLDVFISYPSQNKQIADAICAVLEQDHIRCWIAPRDIVPGEDWSAAIVDGIVASKVMVLVFSEFTNNSHQVKREVERAVKNGKAIIPFRIDGAQMNKAMEYFLGTSHWLDALTPPLERHIRSLSEAVQALLRAGPDGPAGPVVSYQRTTRIRLPGDRMVLLTTVQVKGGALHIQVEPEQENPDTFANRLATAVSKFWPKVRDHHRVIQLVDIEDISVRPGGRASSFLYTVLAGSDFATVKIRTRQGEVVEILTEDATGLIAALRDVSAEDPGNAPAV